MHRKLIICLSFLVLCGGNALLAQNYTTGIGLRGGFWNGFTVKHYTAGEVAIEGILTTRWNGFNITALYEKHKYNFNSDKWDWYYGFGGHIGFWNDVDDHPWFDETGAFTVFGIDGILGIEFTFSEVPLNISLDWKPAVNFGEYYGFNGDGAALSFRFVF